MQGMALRSLAALWVLFGRPVLRFGVQQRNNCHRPTTIVSRPVSSVKSRRTTAARMSAALLGAATFPVYPPTHRPGVPTTPPAAL